MLNLNSLSYTLTNICDFMSAISYEIFIKLGKLVNIANLFIYIKFKQFAIIINNRIYARFKRFNSIPDEDMWFCIP